MDRMICAMLVAASLSLGACQTTMPDGAAARGDAPAAARGRIYGSQLDAAPKVELGSYDSEAAALAAWRAAKPPAGTWARAIVAGRPIAIDSDGRVSDIVYVAPSGEPMRPPQ